MKLPKINKNIILVLILSFIVIYTGVISAEELSLEKVIELGLENNKEINDARESVRQVERNLTRNIISNDWQISLSGDYDYNFDRDGDSKSLSINTIKSFLSGFEIGPGTRIRIDKDLDPSFYISLKQPLYPKLPSALAEEYYRTERKLLKAQRKLKEVKIDSILSWLEIYLNINRMMTRQDLYNESLAKAEDNFAIVLEREKIGDAGKSEILAAELSLENARYSLMEAENRLEDTYYTLASGLGLMTEEKIVIIDKNQYLDKLRSKAGDYAEEYLQKDTTVLMELVKENNNELKANLLDREVLEEELKWLEKSDDPNLDLTGSYGTDNEELTVGLSLSYQLYDGGQHKMALEDKEKEIADNLSTYDDIYSRLNQELKQHFDKLELSRMALKRGELSLARRQYELEVAEKQLEMGLIDYLEYQDYWIAAAEAEIEIITLENELFLSRMEFIKFLDQDLIFELLGGIDG